MRHRHSPHWCTFIFRIARTIITTKFSLWKQNTWSAGSLWLRLRRVKWTRMAQSVRTYIAGRTERAWRHDAHARRPTVTLWYFLRDISEPADASCLNYRVLSNRRNISGQFGRASFDLKRRRMTITSRSHLHVPGDPLVAAASGWDVGRLTDAETRGWFTS